MKYVVVGVERSAGSFKDKNDQREITYDNILLHCFVTDDNPNARTQVLAGNSTGVVKVKNDFSQNVIKNGCPVENFSELLGCVITPFYNRYGSVDCIRVENIDGTV